MDCVWDARKAAANRKKHGVSVEEACAALRDHLAATAADPDHSKGQAHWVTFGVSDQVVYSS